MSSHADNSGLDNNMPLDCIAEYIRVHKDYEKLTPERDSRSKMARFYADAPFPDFCKLPQPIELIDSSADKKSTVVNSWQVQCFIEKTQSCLSQLNAKTRQLFGRFVQMLLVEVQASRSYTYGMEKIVDVIMTPRKDPESIAEVDLHKQWANFYGTPTLDSDFIREYMGCRVLPREEDSIQQDLTQHVLNSVSRDMCNLGSAWVGVDISTEQESDRVESSIIVLDALKSNLVGKDPTEISIMSTPADNSVFYRELKKYQADENTRQRKNFICCSWKPGGCEYGASVIEVIKSAEEFAEQRVQKDFIHEVQKRINGTPIVDLFNIKIDAELEDEKIVMKCAVDFRVLPPSKNCIVTQTA